MHVPLDERTQRWSEAAATDLAVAERLRCEAPHLSCFHAQQSAEKALKASLTRRSGDAPPIHALARLLDALDAMSVPIPESVRDSAESLDKYDLPTRYPDALGFADAAIAYKPRDADAALSAARAVLAWAREDVASLQAAEPGPP
ncbi:MAG: HEPN domain-containing protein [Candidatus Eremiobacteraeota bacterium]|nr:HEPN domain-containing protein [Candidatus Eremiobacteraeota bacterium]MBC5802903.1 HEPN domain-containing protein [Candidatus Eremiobacteraeota bacterium]MBC5821156.1 HEPN domain-containing protein [Candidatus Eremiobacteraeota bacterium]